MKRIRRPDRSADAENHIPAPDEPEADLVSPENWVPQIPFDHSDYLESPDIHTIEGDAGDAG